MLRMGSDMENRLTNAEMSRRKEAQGLGLRNAAVAVAMLALSGCASMAPEYTRPDTPVPAAWPTGAAYSESRELPGAPTAAEIHWREFFTDPRLQEIIETALKNNRDLRLAALNVERARGIYGIQRAELLPTVEATASGSRERLPGILTNTGHPLTTTQYNVRLGITSWEIDFFGRLRSLKDKALEEYLATEQARRSVQVSLISAVAEAYLTLAADREALALSKSTLETQQAAYDLVKRRYEVGIASALDLNRAQTQVDTAKVSIALYTQLAAQDENALNLLVGSSTPVAREILPADLAGVSTPREITAGISSEVLLHRPDIVAQEHLLKAANANIGAARAAFFPRISLTSFLGTASDDLSGLFKSGSQTWAFLPQVVMPIFDARLWSAMDVAKSDKEIALVQYEKAIQNAFREVADALAVRGTVDEQVAAQQSLTDATAKTYRLSQARYDKGVDNYLSVLDSQRSLYSAQQGLIAVRFSRLANLVTLYKVLGGGADE
jgi:multidrug efflux system outer membrane protein